MDFIQQIESLFNKKAIIEFLPMQAGDVNQTYANIEKSKKLLNYNPKTNIKDGLEKFISWYNGYYSF